MIRNGITATIPLNVAPHQQSMPVPVTIPIPAVVTPKAPSIGLLLTQSIFHFPETSVWCLAPIELSTLAVNRAACFKVGG